MWCHLLCVCSHHEHTQHIKSHWIWSIHIHNVFALVSHQITLPFCIRITFFAHWMDTVGFIDSPSSFSLRLLFQFFLFSPLHSLSQTPKISISFLYHTHTDAHAPPLWIHRHRKVATKAAIQSSWLVGFIWIRFVGMQRSENLARVKKKQRPFESFPGKSNKWNNIVISFTNNNYC